MATTRGTAFTTTMGMIDRIHDNTTIMRSFTQPPRASGLAERLVFMIGITDLTDRCRTFQLNFAHLARRK